MSIDWLINKIVAADRKLSQGARTVANVTNEWISISNYGISSLLFGAYGGFSFYQLVTELSKGTQTSYYIVGFKALETTFAIYQVTRNRQLEHLEKESTGQISNTVAVNFHLLKEKRAVVGFFELPPAKPCYIWVLLADMSLVLLPDFGKDLALLLGQYFREVDYTRPGKPKVVEWLNSLVPRLTIKPGHTAAP